MARCPASMSDIRLPAHSRSPPGDGAGICPSTALTMPRNMPPRHSTTSVGTNSASPILRAEPRRNPSGIATYDITTITGASASVQRSITGFAVAAGLTLISNSEEALDLETVFLRLIDQKEVAA